MSTAERWRGFRELPADLARRLEQLPDLLEREGVLLTYLFGSLVEEASRAREGLLAAEASERPAPRDVDLALLMPAGRPAYRLREAITDCLDTQRIDVVDLRRASPVLRMEIVRNGRVLYAAGDDVQLQFELETVRLYQDTNWLRQQQRKILKGRTAQWLSIAKESKPD